MVYFLNNNIITFGTIDTYKGYKEYYIDMYEMYHEDYINSTNIKDFDFNKIYKLPKDWTYNTKLFNFERKYPYKYKIDNCYIDNKEQVKNAIINGYLVKKQSLYRIETEINKNTYKIVKKYGNGNYGYSNYSNTYTILPDSQIFNTYSEAEQYKQEKILLSKKLANMSDEEYDLYYENKRKENIERAKEKQKQWKDKHSNPNNYQYYYVIHHVWDLDNEEDEYGYIDDYMKVFNDVLSRKDIDELYVEVINKHWNESNGSKEVHSYKLLNNGKIVTKYICNNGSIELTDNKIHLLDISINTKYNIGFDCIRVLYNTIKSYDEIKNYCIRKINDIFKENESLKNIICDYIDKNISEIK